MKLREMIRKIDKSSDNEDDQSYIDEEILRAVGAGTTWIKQDPENMRLRSYWLCQWLCTDTLVGIRVLFLDGVSVGIIQQFARKDDAVVYFIDKEARDRVRSYVQSLIDAIDDEPAFVDLDVDFGTHYNLNYREQLTSDRIYSLGKPVKIVSHSCFGEPVTVEYEDGKRETIPMSDIEIRYNVED